MTQPFRTLIAISVALIGSALPAWAAPVGTIRQEKPEFTLKVPGEFMRLPALGDFLYTFGTSDPADGGQVPDAFVGIQRLGGTIGRRPPVMPAEIKNARESKIRWKLHDLDVLSRQITMFDETVESVVVQVPLKDEAIQLIVIVPVEKKATALPILVQFLNGLDGPSNWGKLMTDTDRRELHQIAGVSLGIAVLVVVAFSVVEIVGRRRQAALKAKYPSYKRKSTRERANNIAIKVFAAAALLWFFTLVGVLLIGISKQSEMDHTLGPAKRVELIITGAAKMSFFVGLIAYGITRAVIAIRHPKPPLLPPMLGPS